MAQLVDVTDEVLSSAALRSTTEQFRLLAENASDVVFQTDLDDVITWISPSVTRVLGWPPESIVGTHSLALVHPDFVEVGRELRQQAHGGSNPAALSSRYRTAAGGFLDVSTLARPVIDDTGLVTGTVFGLRDITEERRAQMALEYGERQFRLVVQAAPQGMAVSTPDGVIVMTNPALCALLGREEPEVVGRSLMDFLTPEDAAHDRRVLAELTEDSPTLRLHHRLVSGDHEVWVDHAVSLFGDPGGSGMLHVHQFVDQTATHRLQLELAYRATHDELTGLANRGESISRLTAHAAHPTGLVSLLFCDVDNLKLINDRFGHPTGDVVIAALAERLTHGVRQADSVGRIGGDEFLVILADVGTVDELRRIATKLQEDVSHPVKTQDHLVDLTLSVGAVVLRPGEDPDAILARADRALYRAKEQGRNRVEVDQGG